MRSRLGLSALIAIVVAGIETAIFVGALAKMPVAAADIVGLAGASVLAYFLSRTLSFKGDKQGRWVSAPVSFFSVALVGGLADLAVLVTLYSMGVSELGAKAAGIVVAGIVRWMIYRRVLFHRVRTETGSPISRPPLPNQLRLSVVLPAYNESALIGDSVLSMSDALESELDHGEFEIVVVDDGSTDDTASRANEAGARVVKMASNKGKGAAVRAGIHAAEGRAVVFTDADLAYPAQLVLSVLAKVEQGWDVVVGSRRHSDTDVVIQPSYIRSLGGRIVNLFTRIVLLGRFRDTQCGIKGFRADIAKALFARTRLDGFAFDVEVLLLAEQDRLSVVEIPVSVSNRAGSSVRLLKDTFSLLVDMVKIRWWVGAGVYEATCAQQAVIDADVTEAGLSGP